MQELIYVSDAKLRQFVPVGRHRSRLGRRLTALRLNASALSVEGSLEVDLAEGGADSADRARLAEVVRQLEEHALWYQDPEVWTGRWVYFEAPFNVLNGPEHRQTVLFIDAATAGGDERASLESVRLLLHGSPKHLLVSIPESPVHVPGLSGSAFSGIFHELREDPPPSVDRIDFSFEPRRLGFFLTSAWDLSDASDCSPESAAWMRGYARVTVASGTSPRPRQVIATPLYVEYAYDLP
ncbi:SAVMC3_10250 family protein [Streptomyces sp. NPDC001139]